MKKWTISLLILIPCFCFAQKYMPLINADTINWKTTWHWADANGNGHPSEVKSSLFGEIEPWSSPDTIYHYFQNDELPVGNIVIREDTTSRKVFARNPDFGSEVLIYDFNLMEGDTFDPGVYLADFDVFYNCYNPFIVEKVEYLDYEGIERKTMLMRKLPIEDTLCRISYYHFMQADFKIIEGIGASTWFDYFDTRIHSFIHWNPERIRCIHKDSELVYSDDCGIFSSTKQNDFRLENGLELFPNPVDNQLGIKFSERNFGSGKIRILNTSGQILIERMLEGEFDFVTEDIDEFPSGFYFLFFENSEGRTVKKFLKR